MKTAAQRKEEFLAELQQLCYKHRCEIMLSDDHHPYGMHSPIVVLSFDGEYNNGETVEEAGVFELDSFYFQAYEDGEF